jgi:hypothetical protein
MMVCTVSVSFAIAQHTQGNEINRILVAKKRLVEEIDRDIHN